MRQRFLIPGLLIIGLLALAGCGSSSSSSSSSTPSSTPAPASTPATTPSTSSSASGGGVTVAMKNIAFAPTTIRVKVGQKITWTNDDAVEHNVTSKSGEKIASPNFGQGATFSFTPTKAGTINYVCTIHPGMDGTIVVTK